MALNARFSADQAIADTGNTTYTDVEGHYPALIRVDPVFYTAGKLIDFFSIWVKIKYFYNLNSNYRTMWLII